jgi:hypothetical protein
VAQAYLTRFDENERIYSMMGVTQRDIVSYNGAARKGCASVVGRTWPVSCVVAKAKQDQCEPGNGTSRRSSQSKQTTVPTRSRAKQKSKQQLSATRLKDAESALSRPRLGFAQCGEERMRFSCRTNVAGELCTSRRSSQSKQTTVPTRSRAKQKSKQQLSATRLKASAVVYAGGGGGGTFRRGGSGSGARLADGGATATPEGPMAPESSPSVTEPGTDKVV